MKLALIPPISWLSTSDITGYQLMLPHLFRERKYLAHYTRLASIKNQYLILDNGEAEGMNDQTSAQLVGRAMFMRADEVVVPDVMKDSVATLNKAETFFKEVSQLDNQIMSSVAGGIDVAPKVNLRYMAVAQGSSIQETLDCIDMIMAVVGGYIKTIALPRHLLETCDYPTVRLELAEYIRSNYRGMDIHCLGAAPSWPAEMKALAEQNIVRGMDTSMPYNFAYFGYKLDDASPGPVSRPYNYFAKKEKDFPNDILHHNIGVCRRWVGAVPAANRLDT